MKIEWKKNSGSLQGLVQAGKDQVTIHGVGEDHQSNVERIVSGISANSGVTFVNAAVSTQSFAVSDPGDAGVIVYHGILPEVETVI